MTPSSTELLLAAGAVVLFNITNLISPLGGYPKIPEHSLPTLLPADWPCSVGLLVHSAPTPPLPPRHVLAEPPQCDPALSLEITTVEYVQFAKGNIPTCFKFNQIKTASTKT